MREVPGKIGGGNPFQLLTVRKVNPPLFFPTHHYVKEIVATLGRESLDQREKKRESIKPEREKEENEQHIIL